MKPYQQRMRQWRRKMTRRLCTPRAGPTSPLLVMSYITEAPPAEQLVEAENLTIALCYEEPGRQFRPTIRMAGYTARLTSNGVVFGGSGNRRFFKDVTAKPAKAARDHRLDLYNGRLFKLALRMEAHLRRHQGHPHKPRREAIRFPPLLAGFRTSVARRLGLVETQLTSDLDEAGAVSHAEPREYFGLQMFILDDVVQHLGHCTAIFADLAGWPLVQSIQFTNLSSDLYGRRGPIEFDFRNSEFQRRRRKRRGKSDRAKTKRRHVA